MNKLTLTAAGLLLATTAAASAGSATSNVDARMDRQAQSIEQGRRDGSITWREGLKLRAEQREIAKTEAQFLSDGHLSKSERRTLKNMQDEAGEHIYDSKHNSRHRPDWLPRVGR